MGPVDSLPPRVSEWFEHLAALRVRRVWIRADLYHRLVMIAGGVEVGYHITICGVEVHERRTVSEARQLETFHVRFTSHERVW